MAGFVPQMAIRQVVHCIEVREVVCRESERSYATHARTAKRTTGSSVFLPAARTGESRSSSDSFLPAAPDRHTVAAWPVAGGRRGQTMSLEDHIFTTNKFDKE